MDLYSAIVLKLKKKRQEVCFIIIIRPHYNQTIK